VPCNVHIYANVQYETNIYAIVSVEVNFCYKRIAGNYDNSSYVGNNLRA